jgi:patatin-like phospholipase/acyl hydrolase
VLAQIEAELGASSGKPDLVLADCFDYVAGTSTGAIIMTLVSLGFSIEKVREFYIKSAAEMFQPAKLWDRLHTKFKDDNLTTMLKNVAGKRYNAWFRETPHPAHDRCPRGSDC